MKSKPSDPLETKLKRSAKKAYKAKKTRLRMMDSLDDDFPVNISSKILRGYHDA